MPPIETTTTLSEGDVVKALEGQLYPEETQDTANVAPDQDVDSEVVQEDDTSTLEDDTEDDSEELGEEGRSLAEYLGINENDLIVKDDGTVLVNAKVDGEIVQAKLTDLVKSYQLESHIQRKSQELASQKKQIEESINSARQMIDQKLTQASSLTNYLEQQIISEYNSINWEQLKQTNPTEFVLKRQEFAERAQAVEKAKTLILQEKQQKDQELLQQEQEQFRQYLQSQAEQMIAKNPTWAIPEEREKAVGEITNFLTSTYGFSAEDLNHVSDHRLVTLIQDAMAYHKGKKAVVNKVNAKVVPKFQKPGRSAQTSAARAAKEKRARLRATGSQTDLAAILVDKM